MEAKLEPGRLLGSHLNGFPDMSCSCIQQKLDEFSQQVESPKTPRVVDPREKRREAYFGA